MMMNRPEILDCFYAAMPDDLSLEDCAAGVNIEFEYGGKKYSIPTASLSSLYRTRPISAYYTELESRVYQAVREGVRNED